MDNNLNNNSGIPNVSDIKFDDTPAESFENLYGANSQNNSSVGVNVSPAQPVMPEVQAPVQPVMPEVQAPVQPVMPEVQAPAQLVMPEVQAPAQPVMPEVQAPAQSVMPEVQAPAQPVMPEVQAPAQPVVGGVNPVGTENPGVALNMNQGPVMTSNPVDVTSNGASLSNVNIDADKMQSIEEQLSKTSQYNPSDFQQEQISIPTDNQSEKNKSGLGFVIALFVLLGCVVAFLPYITKLIK